MGKDKPERISFQKTDNKQAEEQQQHFTPKRQYTTQRKKLNFKKWKTTIAEFILDDDVNENDNQILRSLKSSQSHKKSVFTKQLNFYKQNFAMEIRVKYFGTRFIKSLYVDEEIRAAELIVLALKEYQLDPKSDKSKYEYQNFSLAYQLIGSEASPTKQTYNNDDDFNNDSDMPNDESLEKADIDLESQVFYKTVELVPATKLFGLDFETIVQISISNPELIILLIEDPRQEIFYHIKVRKDGDLNDCLTELNRKVSKKYLTNEYYLSLKYSCINYDFGDINEKLPISQLPLHWLLILERKKHTSDVILSISQDDSHLFHNRTFNNLNPATENGTSLNSYRFLSIDFMQLGKLEKMPLLYSYQEYNLIKYSTKNGCLNEVIVGLDYFDFHYQYISKQTKRGKFNNFIRKIVKVLSLSQFGVPDCKRIPITSITDLNKQKKDKYFEISYELSDGYTKKVFFLPKNDDKNVIKEAFTKLEYLVSIQQQLQ